MGIPGTGLFYTTPLTGGKSGKGRSSYSSASPTVNPKDRLTLGFFKRLVTPDDEEALVDGCRELVLGDENKALRFLKKAAHQLIESNESASTLFVRQSLQRYMCTPHSSIEGS